MIVMPELGLILSQLSQHYPWHFDHQFGRMWIKDDPLIGVLCSRHNLDAAPEIDYIPKIGKDYFGYPFVVLRPEFNSYKTDVWIKSSEDAKLFRMSDVFTISYEHQTEPRYPDYPYRVSLHGWHKTEQIVAPMDWCRNLLGLGNYHTQMDGFYFRTEDDAMLFVLVWRGTRMVD